ncbi:SbcC/MukB-like Walker B domain-containing protein [Tsukamurella sp. 8F]|uniref:ATP-binding protein n=1 Tax=unclassified Tsukamurella TaxID=2633480 RepID=UPI0023B8DB35|nr:MULTISPECIES: ATP-binding protein [unclassified Tsukamurella]MDF0529248.1 SbcC/MukB-like Walker B domain-containing protein [Tsukamurella sp. 8J]MDF0585433.1 SbcC/MukB-like Walker B domain-containing protein [Tsukamurella sp. 8F]
MSRTRHVGQFRLVRLQVVNWGTFDGYKDFPIDDRGVILTGPSGSGKSSLMDAHSVVLLPTYDQAFNASADLTAKGARKAARSMADYVRGAWSVNDDEHNQSKVQYLRGESATWSAIAATYDNGAGGATTAVAVKWFPGSGTDGASLRSWYLLRPGNADLMDLSDWAASGFDSRSWRARHPETESFDTQAAYQDALRRRVGIGESSAALSLLGKAKAMKNVGDLDAFIRTYMLDRPGTYAKAERLVENFTQLDEAYRAAARAEAQEKVLRPVPEAYERYQSAHVSHTRAGDLLGGTLRGYLRTHRIRLLQAEMDRIEGERAGLDARIARWENTAEQRKHAYDSLADQLRSANGDVGALETELAGLDRDAAGRLRAYERYAATVERIGERAPESEEEFFALREQLPGIRDRAAQRQSALAARVHQAYSAESDARRDVEAVDAELATLHRRSSLLPAIALDQRDEICRATGLRTDELPYAAELIDVRSEDQAVWGAAAERVLRPLAMTLLVPERRARAVAEYVDAHRVRGVLTYQVYTPTDRGADPEPGSLATKLDVDIGHPAGPWLTGTVARTARHACVADAADLDDHEIAVTPGGLVKSPGRRFRKDDRASVSDRSQWVLGTRTDTKREALERRRVSLQAVHAKAEEASRAIRDELAEYKDVADGANHVLGYSAWSEVDHWLARDEADALRNRISDRRSGDSDLGELELRVDDAFAELAEAQSRIGALNQSLNRAGDDFDVLLAEFEKEGGDSASDRTPDDDREFLDTALWYLLETSGKHLTLETFGEIRSDLRAELERQQAAATAERDAAEQRIVRAGEAFLREWPDAATELTATIEGAADLVAVHENLVAHGLASATERFRRLITTDVSHSVANLYKEIEDTHRHITRGIADVNSGLARVEFNEGTYLQIAYAARPAPEAKDFAKLVDDMVRDAPAARRGEAAAMAAQFKRIRGLVMRLTADDLESRRWAESVLDVRTGYSFYGRENAAGASPDEPAVHTYRNTATNSGGEQEKLVAFCLAAALSFSLGSHETLQPTFAPLMLDEAFSKSDERFSAQSLRAFERFGFQLIIAAPIRMVGIVEPFIGQVVLVDKRMGPDGARSDARIATFGELASRSDRHSAASAGD